jgi:hypothetical protein
MHNGREMERDREREHESARAREKERMETVEFSSFFFNFCSLFPSLLHHLPLLPHVLKLDTPSDSYPSSSKAWLCARGAGPWRYYLLLFLLRFSPPPSSSSPPR